jgi:hypothetical protein
MVQEEMAQVQRKFQNRQNGDRNLLKHKYLKGCAFKAFFRVFVIETWER